MTDYLDMVTLTCKARVRSEVIEVRQAVPRVVYDDPEAREAIEKSLRVGLAMKIVNRWKPRIEVW